MGVVAAIIVVSDSTANEPDISDEDIGYPVFRSFTEICDAWLTVILNIVPTAGLLVPIFTFTLIDRVSFSSPMTCPVPKLAVIVSVSDVTEVVNRILFSVSVTLIDAILPLMFNGALLASLKDIRKDRRLASAAGAVE